MTYNIRERSAEDGAPIEIYTFARGPLTWRYTSSDREQVVETQAYEPAVIRRGRIRQGPEVARSVLQLYTQRNLRVLDQYRQTPPSDDVTLVIRQFHLGDSEYKQIWEGVVIGVTFSTTTNEAAIQVEPPSNGMRKMGLRRMYQRQCPFQLYGPDCKVNTADHRVTDTVAGITGADVTVPLADLQPDGYFNHGFFEWEVALGIFDRRSILSHVGSTLSLDAPPNGLELNQEARFYPGCPRTIEVCDSRFNNRTRFGGMPYLPLKNPFGSDPVY